MPKAIDVLVIGSGYTGLMAALQTARAGRSTLVVDAEALGWGCSSRNGGHVTTGIKPSFSSLSGRTNHETAFAIRKEGLNALDFIDDFIRSEKLDCDWRWMGRFGGAHNPRQFQRLVRLWENQPKGLEVPYEVIPKSEQHREIGSDYYHGGVVRPRIGGLDPAKYHRELLRLAKSAGILLVDHCPAQSIERNGSGFVVTTAKGKVRASNVVIATNGYTGPFAPWHRRRVIPIGSYIIATEPRDPSEMRPLIPNDRTVDDTRQVIFYFRLSPDGRSMIFGGRVAYMETDPLVSAPRLFTHMTKIFPSLKSVAISHSWAGFVAFTFDFLPHIGVKDGVHYAMGYCGSGVSLSTYFGMRIGQQLLGKPEAKTPLGDITFQSRPLYYGNPWFLAPSVWWYSFLDRLPI